MGNENGSPDVGNDAIKDDQKRCALDPWNALRGSLKEVYAEYCGGEAYLKREREEFNRAMKAREQEIERVREESRRRRNSGGSLRG